MQMTKTEFRFEEIHMSLLLEIQVWERVRCYRQEIIHLVFDVFLMKRMTDSQVNFLKACSICVPEDIVGLVVKVNWGLCE